MKTIRARNAGKSLDQLLEEIAVTGEPVRITSRGASAVLVSEADWRALQETLHLALIPGMAESVREGLETPLDECFEDA